jgi:serine/threonine protein kinase
VTIQPHYSIILEYCAKGSLWSYLQNPENNISWEERRRFALEIAQGVLYLHLCSPPILHRDLKSLNIFLDGNLKIKIGDFGWTKTL